MYKLKYTPDAETDLRKLKKRTFCIQEGRPSLE